MKIFNKVIRSQEHLSIAKQRLLDAIPFWIAGLGTALAATLYSVAFKFMEEQSQSVFLNFGYYTLLITPVLFVLSWAVVELFSPYASGSGIPQLMAAAEISKKNENSPFLDKLLGARIIFVKVISSLLAVLGGGAIGREGPTLQISGVIFNLTGKMFSKNLWSKNHHGMILAGGAAGLASAFNTPLGGIVYVLEELSKSHLSNFRTGILHAVIVAGLVAQLIMGPYLYFGFPKIEPFHLSNLIVVLIVSILVAVIASLFAQSLKSVVVLKSELKSLRSKAIVAAFSGLLIACVALFLTKSVMGSGKELLNVLLFDGKHAGFLDAFSRFFGSVITYSAGGAGGIFAPVLSIGGVSASYILNLMGNDLGALGVLIGMTAALAALTHSPLTAFILILEMTDRHSAIFPLMISAVIGHGVSKLISKQSFYEFVCERFLAVIDKKNNIDKES